MRTHLEKLAQMPATEARRIEREGGEGMRKREIKEGSEGGRQREEKKKCTSACIHIYINYPLHNLAFAPVASSRSICMYRYTHTYTCIYTSHI